MGSETKLASGVLNAEQAGKTVAELESLGCKFVVEGNVYQAVISLLEKLLIDGAADVEGEAFLLQLRAALLQTSKPVRERVVSSDETRPRVQIAYKLPGLPQSLKLIK